MERQNEEPAVTNTKQKTEWHGALENGTIANATAWHFPIMYWFLKLLPAPTLQSLLSSHKKLYERGETAVANSHSTTGKNMFANILAQAEKDDTGLTNTDIVIEAGSFSIAGTDTTANTLTYLVWAVVSDSKLQKSLEAEVTKVEEPITDAKLEELPILNAVIKETLRLYGAAPGALPRIVPSGGSRLGGYLIPGGTTVSTQAWSLHRDPGTFPNPDK